MTRMVWPDFAVTHDSTKISTLLMIFWRANVFLSMYLVSYVDVCARTQGAAAAEEPPAAPTGWGGKKSFLDVSRFG